MSNISVNQIDSIALVTVTRPKVLNAINSKTIKELHETFRELKEDTKVRVVILTGEGDRAFIAGADISELTQMTPTSAREVARRGQALCDLIEGVGKPVIAAINGFALGGGCEIAMACTFRLAADTAKIGQPEVNLGLIAGFGGSQRLPRLVGPGPALELLLTGDTVTADEAWRLGLVNHVFPSNRLQEETHLLASKLAAKPPLAVKYTLDAVQRGMNMSLSEGCDFEATLFGLVAATDDMREGTQAFLGKRKAEFLGR